MKLNSKLILNLKSEKNYDPIILLFQILMKIKTNCFYKLRVYLLSGC